MKAYTEHKTPAEIAAEEKAIQEAVAAMGTRTVIKPRWRQILDNITSYIQNILQ